MQSNTGYNNTAAIAQAVNAGRHREAIGGQWDQIGQLQFRFMVGAGLQPHHTLLDVGCGSLRGGVHFVRYLDAGRYYGIDLNRSLLDAGYEKEVVPLGLAARLPRENLACVADFDASRFGGAFDFLLAVSLFSHLEWCQIRLCMQRLADVSRPGSTFLATYFDLPEDLPAAAARVHQPGGITTFGHADPFHYRVSDFSQAVRGLPWVVVNAVDWGHPRDQRMLTFRRT